MALAACFTVMTAQGVNDSIKTDTLPELIVNADGQIEMADKTLLLPTALEKKHSSNGFELLSVMQTTELDVPRTSAALNTSARRVENMPARLGW